MKYVYTALGLTYKFSETGVSETLLITIVTSLVVAMLLMAVVGFTIPLVLHFKSKIATTTTTTTNGTVPNSESETADCDVQVQPPMPAPRPSWSLTTTGIELPGREPRQNLRNVFKTTVTERGAECALKGS